MKRVNILLALILCAGPVWAIEVDQSTPKATALSFAKALEAGDGAAAHQLVFGTEQEMGVIDATITFTNAVKKLHDAAVKKYADKADEATGTGLTVDSSKALEDTEIKEEADTATLTNTKAQGSQAPMKMKKIDGKWKVNLSETFSGAAALGQDSAKMQSMLKDWTDAVTEVADEVEKGQYPLPADAKQALEARLMAKLKASPATGPSTAPATAPAQSK
jgi:hypothetical protein